MSISPTIYEFDNHKYDLTITHGFAHKVLKPEFDVDLNALFEGNNLDELMIRIFLSNELALKLWWHAIQKNYPDSSKPVIQNGVTIKEELVSGYEVALDKLSTKLLEDFKDRWWAAVSDFLPSLMRETLMTYLEEWPKITKGKMREALLDQQESKLDVTS